MAETVRLGIIGTGQIGKVHIKRYQEIPEADIVAVADIREDEARRVAQQYSIPHVYTSYHDLLARDDIDSVDVCLHNRLHRPVTVDALKAGKNVFCEKPMSWVYKDARTMYDTAKELGRMLHIQLTTLHQPACRAAKRLIDEGHLGEIYYALESPGDGAVELVKAWERKGGDIPGYQLPKISGGLLREESMGLFERYVSMRPPGPMRDWAETLTKL